MQLVISIQKLAVLLKLATPNSLFFLEIYLVLMKIFRQLRLIGFLWRLTPMVLLWLYVLIDKLFFSVYGILLVFLTSRFIMCMIRWFSHFIVVEDHDLSQSSHYLLRVALTLEYIRILSWSISFFSTSVVSLIMSCVRLLSELMILVSIQHVKKYLTCPTSWDSLSFVIWS